MSESRPIHTSRGVKSSKTAMPPLESTAEFLAVLVHELSEAEVHQHFSAYQEENAPAWDRPPPGTEGMLVRSIPAGRFFSALIYKSSFTDFMFAPCVYAGAASGLHDGVAASLHDSSDVLGTATYDQFRIVHAASHAEMLPRLTGSHVELIFNHRESPVYVAAIPMALFCVGGVVAHPRRGAGDLAKTAPSPQTPVAPRHRMPVTRADGDVYRVKHHGSVFEIDANGNVILDTTFAHNGSHDSRGREPGDAYQRSIDGTLEALPIAGDQNLRLRWGQAVTVELVDAPSKASSNTVPPPVSLTFTFDLDGLKISAPAVGAGAGETIAPQAVPLRVVFEQSSASPTVVIKKAETHQAAETELSGVVLLEQLQTFLSGWKTSIEGYMNNHMHNYGPSSPTGTTTQQIGQPLELTDPPETLGTRKLLLETDGT